MQEGELRLNQAIAIGSIEGQDIPVGEADVVVCDGFTRLEQRLQLGQMAYIFPLSRAYRESVPVLDWCPVGISCLSSGP